MLQIVLDGGTKRSVSTKKSCSVGTCALLFSQGNWCYKLSGRFHKCLFWEECLNSAAKWWITDRLIDSSLLQYRGAGGWGSLIVGVFYKTIKNTKVGIKQSWKVLTMDFFKVVPVQRMANWSFKSLTDMIQNSKQ